MEMKSAGLLGVCIIIAAFGLGLVSRYFSNSSGPGRYQLVTGEKFTTFLIDTQTGRVWQKMIVPVESAKWAEISGPLNDDPSK